MRRSFGSLLVLALASCRAGAPAAPVGQDGAAPGSGGAPASPAGGPATPPTATPTDGAGMILQSRTVRMDDDSNVFGFAAYGGRWVIGTAFTDDRDELSLRPVDASLGPALHVLTQSPAGGFPLALVGEADGVAAPWVVSQAQREEEPWRFVARRFDGGAEAPALEVPDHESGISRTAWRAEGGVTGAIVYRFDVSRPLTAAERRAAQKAHEGRGGPSGSISGSKALAHGMRYFGRGAKRPFETAKRPAGDPVDLGWLAAAVGPGGGWIGAHWEQRHEGDAIVETNIALHWFDARSAHVRGTVVPAPPGTSSGQLVLAGDGTAYVIADRTSPFDGSPALEVLAFDPGGAALPARTIPVPGWVADTITSVECGGRPWLVLDAYVTARGEEVITVVGLSPRGDLGTGTVAWSRRDPKPAGQGSRPGRVLHVACSGSKAAAAMQLWDLDAVHELAVVEWEAGAAR